MLIQLSVLELLIQYFCISQNVFFIAITAYCYSNWPRRFVKCQFDVVSCANDSLYG